MILVGCDADGLELRMLGNRMAKYDNGDYAREVVEGDPHTRNQNILGFPVRDPAKTWIYAHNYGAQDPKLGSIVYDAMGADWQAGFNKRHPGGTKRKNAIKKIGRSSRNKIAESIPALAEVVKENKHYAKTRKYLVGLDGRKVPCRSIHSALNTRLQHDGAIIMKRALIICDANLQKAGLNPGKEYEFVLNVHDEFQIETLEDHAEFVGTTAADSIRLAGKYYNMQCPLAGSFDIGRSWAETH